MKHLFSKFFSRIFSSIFVSTRRSLLLADYLRSSVLRYSMLLLFAFALVVSAEAETQYWFVNATLNGNSITQLDKNAKTQWLTTTDATTFTSTTAVSLSSEPSVASIYYGASSFKETNITTAGNWSSSSEGSYIRGFKFANKNTYPLDLGSIKANKIRLIGWCGGTSKTLTIGTKSCTSSSTKNTFEVYTFEDNFTGNVSISAAGDFYGILIVSEAPSSSPCTVTYNANGGNCSTTSETYSGTPLTLPTPTRDGYTFTGWFDDATAGNHIGDAGDPYTPTKDITLFAQWTIAETPYTFSYGVKDQPYTTLNFTRVGTTNEWRITDFVFPDVNTNQVCYVGKGGSWCNDALGSSNAKSADLYFYDMPLALLQNTSCTVKTLGWNKDNSNGHKAIGTLRIFDNYADDNLFVGFIPNGYGLMHGAEGGAWSGLAFAPADANGIVWTTDPVTLTAEMLADTYKYYVGLLTSDGGYTYCGNSETSVLNTMGSNVNGEWGGNLGTFAAGQKGVFRIWANSCNSNNTKNFVCHFLPYYHLTYNANYPAGAGGQPADTQSADYSAESNNAITLPDAPTAPAGYTFNGWYDAATDGNLVGDAGANYAFNQPSANITLYAQWEKIVEPTCNL